MVAKRRALVRDECGARCLVFGARLVLRSYREERLVLRGYRERKGKNFGI